MKCVHIMRMYTPIILTVGHQFAIQLIVVQKLESPKMATLTTQ